VQQDPYTRLYFCIAFVYLSVPPKMGSPSLSNAALEVSKLFDVSHVTAVLSGGGSGLGLMITQVNTSTI